MLPLLCRSANQSRLGLFAPWRGFTRTLSECWPLVCQVHNLPNKVGSVPRGTSGLDSSIYKLSHFVAATFVYTALPRRTKGPPFSESSSVTVNECAATTEMIRFN